MGGGWLSASLAPYFPLPRPSTLVLSSFEAAPRPHQHPSCEALQSVVSSDPKAAKPPPQAPAQISHHIILSRPLQQLQRWRGGGSTRPASGSLKSLWPPQKQLGGGEELCEQEHPSPGAAPGVSLHRKSGETAAGSRGPLCCCTDLGHTARKWLEVSPTRGWVVVGRSLDQMWSGGDSMCSRVKYKEGEQGRVILRFVT